MKERDLQTKVNRYLKNRWQEGTAAFELKICHEKSIPFAAVKEHQVHALKVAKHGLLAYKIPDDTIGAKPFDCVVLAGVPAYVLIMFYKRGCNHFYLIDVDDFENEIQISNRASLTEERAGEIGRKFLME